MSQTRVLSTLCAIALTSAFAWSSSDTNASDTNATDRSVVDPALTPPNSATSGTTSTRNSGVIPRKSDPSDDRASKNSADNSGVNAQDRNGNTLTADRQAEGTKSDVELTREIRREIVKDDSLSMNAKNVKIITKNGVVNLRGPVESASEREKIASIALNYAGAAKVRNFLEVKKQ